MPWICDILGHSPHADFKEMGTIAEVGFVTCASVALRIGRAALPAYRSKFSKRQFTQPRLLAMLCLMRDEDWTFREADVRIAEHSELRAALGLDHMPDYTTLYRFLRRLDETVLASSHWRRRHQAVAKYYPYKRHSAWVI